MGGRLAGQAGGGAPPVAEETRLFKPVAPQQADTDLNLCEKARKEASLTPPSIINALCEGKPVWVCTEAIYVEEVQKLARKLNCDHLLRFDVDC